MSFKRKSVKSGRRRSQFSSTLGRKWLGWSAGVAFLAICGTLNASSMAMIFIVFSFIFIVCVSLRTAGDSGVGLVGEGMGHLAKTVDPGAHGVAGSEVAGRSPSHADSGGGARED